ncbi:MAG: hypothetical protein JXR05_07210 [Flavobacteriaceae bacterium]
MKIYRGKILNSAAFMILKLALIGLFGFVIIRFLFKIDIVEVLNFGGLVIIVNILVLLVLLYALSVNNDIVLLENEIRIRKRLIFYNKQKSIDFKEIKKIQLKHDWTETIASKLKPSILKYILVEWILISLFPPDYKWIKIKTDKETFKYFCFGIEYDQYNNPRPHFDDLYFDLAKRGINVEWTNDTDLYYRDLRKRKEELLKEVNTKQGGIIN